MRKGQERALTVNEVAARLNITAKTVRSLIANGKIKGFKVGHLWRVAESALDKLFESGGIGDDGNRNILREDMQSSDSQTESRRESASKAPAAPNGRTPRTSTVNQSSGKNNRGTVCDHSEAESTSKRLGPVREQLN